MGSWGWWGFSLNILLVVLDFTMLNTLNASQVLEWHWSSLVWFLRCLSTAIKFSVVHLCWYSFCTAQGVCEWSKKYVEREWHTLQPGSDRTLVQSLCRLVVELEVKLLFHTLQLTWLWLPLTKMVLPASTLFTVITVSVVKATLESTSLTAFVALTGYLLLHTTSYVTTGCWWVPVVSVQPLVALVVMEVAQRVHERIR